MKNTIHIKKYYKSHIKSLLRISTCGVSLSICMSYPAGAAQDVNVLEPSIKHYGKTYSELAGEWWNWANQFPFATNPIVEQGDVDCSRGQKGKIWFLAGTFGQTVERSCTIPLGKALFFSGLNTLYWYPEDAPNVDEVRALAYAVRPDDLEVTIDGDPIADPYAYRVQSPPGGFPLENGPLLVDFGFPNLPQPRYPAVTDGYWYLLAPLPRGHHTLIIRTSRQVPAFDMNVTFHLDVE